MKLYEKLKDYFNKGKNSEFEEIQETDNSIELINANFERIDELFKEYAIVVLPQEKKLNGHQHFRRKEIEDEILEIIAEDDRVLLIQDKGYNDYSIGMVAAIYKFERIVDKVLDNKEAAIQKDYMNRTIGSLCAETGLEEMALKSMQYDEIAENVDSFNETIGMVAAKSGLKSVVLKSLEYPNTRFLVDKRGYSIPMICAKNKETNMDDVIEKCLEYQEFYSQQEFDNQMNLGMLLARNGKEELLLKYLENSDEKNQLQQDKFGNNIGMHAADFHLEKAAIKALENHRASIQKNNDGCNIGMVCAHRGLEQATLIALDNNSAAIQTNNYKENIGMIAVHRGLEKCALKALDNKIAALEQDRNGENIAMHAAFYKMESVVLKALDNHEVCMQIGNWKRPLGAYCVHYNLKNCVMKALDDIEASKIKFNLDGYYGINLPMAAANKGWEDCVLKAMEVEELARDADEDHDRELTIYAIRNNMKQAVQRSKELGWFDICRTTKTEGNAEYCEKMYMSETDDVMDIEKE